MIGRPTTRAEAEAAVGRGLHVGEEIVLVAAGGAAAQHLGDRELDAVGDELRPDHFRLGRPDVLLQPAHQRQVVGDAAQQRHRVVRVRVDQAGDQRVLVDATTRFARREARARVGDRQQRDDAIAVDRDGVVFEHHAVRLDRDDPAGFDQQVAGFRGAGRHRLTSRATRIRRNGCRP